LALQHATSAEPPVNLLSFRLSAQRQSPAALTQIEDSVTNWNFMVENGQTVSVGSDVLFGGSGFEYGRAIGFEPYCSKLSVVSIFLADAM